MFKKTPATPLGKSFVFRTRYYEDQLTVDPGLGTANNYVFSANGLYDPNFTGTGHQPIGFDQIMQMYDHYCVIGSRIRVTFHNNDASDPCTVGVYVSDTTVSSTDPTQIIENGLGKYKTIEAAKVGGSVKTITLGSSTKKRTGTSHPLSDPNLKGSASANPSEGHFFHIWAAAPDGSDHATVGISVCIEYIAIMTEPKQLSLS